MPGRRSWLPGFRPRHGRRGPGRGTVPPGVRPRCRTAGSGLRRCGVPSRTGLGRRAVASRGGVVPSRAGLRCRAVGSGCGVVPSGAGLGCRPVPSGTGLRHRTVAAVPGGELRAARRHRGRRRLRRAAGRTMARRGCALRTGCGSGRGLRSETVPRRVRVTRSRSGRCRARRGTGRALSRNATVPAAVRPDRPGGSTLSRTVPPVSGGRRLSGRRRPRCGRHSHRGRRPRCGRHSRRSVPGSRCVLPSCRRRRAGSRALIALPWRSGPLPRNRRPSAGRCTCRSTGDGRPREVPRTTGTRRLPLPW
jgi:hypothetical protein